MRPGSASCLHPKGEIGSRLTSRAQRAVGVVGDLFRVRHIFRRRLRGRDAFGKPLTPSERATVHDYLLKHTHVGEQMFFKALSRAEQLVLLDHLEYNELPLPRRYTPEELALGVKPTEREVVIDSTHATSTNCNIVFSGRAVFGTTAGGAASRLRRNERVDVHRDHWLGGPGLEVGSEPRLGAAQRPKAGLSSQARSRSSTPQLDTVQWDWSKGPWISGTVVVVERARKQKPSDDSQTIYCYRYGVRLDGPDGHGKGVFVPQIGALYVRRHKQRQHRDQSPHVQQMQPLASKIAKQSATQYHQLTAGQVFGTLRLPPSIAFSSCTSDVERNDPDSASALALSWQVVDEDSPTVSAAEYSCVRLKAPAEWLTFPASCLDTLQRLGQQREVIDLLRAVGLGALVTPKAIKGEVADSEDELPLLQHMHVKYFESGHVLLQEGACAAQVYIVMEGECRELLEAEHLHVRKCDNRSAAKNHFTYDVNATTTASVLASASVRASVPETAEGTRCRQRTGQSARRMPRPHTAPRLRAGDSVTSREKLAFALRAADADNIGSEPQFVLPSGYVGQKSPRQQLLSLGPHAIFGDVAVLQAVPQPASVVARSRVRVLEIAGAPFVRALRKHPALHSTFLARCHDHRAMTQGRALATEAATARHGSVREHPMDDTGSTLQDSPIASRKMDQPPVAASAQMQDHSVKRPQSAAGAFARATRQTSLQPIKRLSAHPHGAPQPSGAAAAPAHVVSSTLTSFGAAAVAPHTQARVPYVHERRGRPQSAIAVARHSRATVAGGVLSVHMRGMGKPSRLQRTASLPMSLSSGECGQWKAGDRSGHRPRSAAASRAEHDRAIQVAAAAFKKRVDPLLDCLDRSYLQPVPTLTRSRQFHARPEQGLFTKALTRSDGFFDVGEFTLVHGNAGNYS